MKLRLLLLAVLPALVACGRADPPLDVLIHGGLVVDGTASPPRWADVGIREDRVAAIGFS